jgi:hypothetical protein
VLIDNAKALVEHDDPVTREVRFNARLHAFARYWGFTPRACAPYRARTKGKDERGVGYVKKNAIAGRRFESWAEFEAHLDRWTREVADQREHGTTGVKPAERFADEEKALRPLAGRASFGQLRDLVRKVQADCAIDLDTNSYSVPWRLSSRVFRSWYWRRVASLSGMPARWWPIMPCAMDDDNGSWTGRILSVLPAPRVWCEPPHLPVNLAGFSGQTLMQFAVTEGSWRRRSLDHLFRDRPPRKKTSTRSRSSEMPNARVKLRRWRGLRR